MIKVKYPDNKEFPYLIIKFCPKVVLKEIQAIKIHTLKNKWRRTNSSDQNNNLKLEENSKVNRSMLLTIMIKELHKKEKKLIFLTIKLCHKASSKVHQLMLEITSKIK